MDDPDPPPASAAAPRRLTAGLAAGAAVVTVGMWTHRASIPVSNDDVAYLLDACGLVGPRSLEWGPGYAAVYCLLRRVASDPLTAFWAKQSAVPLLAGLLVHRLGLRFRLGPVLASLSALWCVLALLAVNGTVEFAFVLGLTACLAAVSGERWGWVWFFVFMGLALLVRFEYVVAVAGAMALLLWGREEGVGWGRAAGALILVGFVGLVAAYGREAGGRSWFAFGQLFAVNYAEARGIDLDPVEWQRATGQVFPHSRSIAGALRENPRMVAWHVAYNLIVRMPRAAAGALVPVPSFVPWLRSRAVVAVLVLVLVLVAALGGAGGDGLRGPRRLPLIALATVPAVSLLFRPQSRHFLPLLPLAIAIVGTRLRRRPGERHPRLVAALRLAFGGVLLAGLASAWVTWAAPANGAASMDSWIRELREETRARPVRLLASWYGDRVCRLVGPGCRPVSLPEFIDGQEIDAALIGPDWAKSSDVRGDDRLAGFASRPEDLGCQAGAVLPEGFRVVRCHPPLRRRPRPPAASADGRSG